jgi:hypothetical protein
MPGPPRGSALGGLWQGGAPWVLLDETGLPGPPAVYGGHVDTKKLVG